MPINETATVRDLALEVPGATRLFEKLGIDYCCGGARPLQEACTKAGLELQDVVRSLEQIRVPFADDPNDRNWKDEPASALVSYIINRHHAFDRQELDRVEPLLEKVSSVYRESHPELTKIAQLFVALKQDLLNHMMKEEQVLFPYINQLEEAIDKAQARPHPFFGSVRNPVRMMMFEHDTVGDTLRRIRELSSDFAIPSDACLSYRTLYQALEGFEHDLHQHIHLENNLLFPKAIQMEQ